MSETQMTIFVCGACKAGEDGASRPGERLIEVAENAKGAARDESTRLAWRGTPDAPVAVAQTVTLDEDTLTNLELKASDVDGDSLTYTVVDQPTKGVLSGTGANRQYVPNRNYSGTDSFSFKVSDGKLESAVVVVSLCNIMMVL